MSKQNSKQAGAMHPEGVYRQYLQALRECLLTLRHLTVHHTSRGQYHSAKGYMPSSKYFMRQCLLAVSELASYSRKKANIQSRKVAHDHGATLSMNTLDALHYALYRVLSKAPHCHTNEATKNIADGLNQ